MTHVDGFFMKVFKNDAWQMTEKTSVIKSSLSQQEGARTCNPFWRQKQPVLGVGHGGDAWTQNSDAHMLQVSTSN